MRTNGTNLASQNPYMQKQIPFRNFAEIRQEIIRLCNEKSGQGLRGLRVFFNTLDRNGNGSIDPKEFKYAMRDFGLELSEIEVTQMIKNYDSNHDGSIQFEELLTALRGTLNHNRMMSVDALFNRLDKAHTGAVELQTLERAYRAANHPAVRSGARLQDDVESEFSNAWSTQRKNGLISRQEFFDYFTEAGANIASDAEFETTLKQMWA